MRSGALAAILLAVHCASADEPGALSLTKTAELTRAGSTINLPGLTIHGGDHKRIEAKGAISLTDGILEFIAVERRGRDYESLLTLECKPSALQFALLLIGCEAGPIPKRAKAGEKAGSRLQIEVEWQADGKTERAPVEKLLLDRHTKKVPAGLPWVFTGSYFTKDLENRELFAADTEQAFIALWWTPTVLVNLGGDYGNPYRAEDQGFEVNKAVIPPKATPVKLIFRKRVP